MTEAFEQLWQCPHRNPQAEFMSTPAMRLMVVQNHYTRVRMYTADSAQQTKAHLDKLLEANKDTLGPQFEKALSGSSPELNSMPEQERANLQKLLFMSGQLEIAQKFIENVAAQEAAWQTGSFMDMPSEEETLNRIRLYEKATSILE